MHARVIRFVMSVAGSSPMKYLSTVGSINTPYTKRGAQSGLSRSSFNVSSVKVFRRAWLKSAGYHGLHSIL